MNRENFKRSFGTASNELDKRAIKQLVKRSVLANQKEGIEQGQYNLILAIEELSELQKEISKTLRGRMDESALTEEIADVLLTIMYVQEICGISTNDIYKAMNVKASRVERVLNERQVYK